MKTTNKKPTAPYETNIYDMDSKKIYTVMLFDPNISQNNIDDLLTKIAMDYAKTLGGKAFLQETNGMLTIKDLFEQVPAEIFSKYKVVPLKHGRSKCFYNFKKNLVSPVPNE